MSESDNYPRPPGAAVPANEPIFNVPTVVLAVVAVLAAIHAALWLGGENWQTWAYYAFSFVPVRLGGGPPVPFPQGAQVWSFLTYAFLHADSFHLGSNCVWLLIFSTPLARRLGAQRYLLFIAVAAIVGAAAVLATQWGKFVIVVGASASVSATLSGALPIMFAHGFNMRLRTAEDYQRLAVPDWRRLIMMPRALVFSAVFLALQLFSGVSQILTGTAFLEERNVAWEAHLGGFVAGLVLFYLLDRRKVPPSFES